MQEGKKQNAAAAVGLAGALIGAGLTAAAIALTDKRNREKVFHTVRSFRKQATDVLNNIDEKMDKASSDPDKKNEVKEEVKQASQKAEDKIYKAL